MEQDSVVLFERAANNAVAMAGKVDAAGTFMDQLVHTWDLALAAGQDHKLADDRAEA